MNDRSSASSASGRVGTASRLSAMTNFRIGTAKNIGIPQKGLMTAERPLTQQGLSGISTASTNHSRQVKDKRYWIALLQTKIQEIVQENEKLKKEKKNLDRETSAKKLYEKKVKEQAKELSALHLTLSDLNLALNSNLSGASRHNETIVFREKNEIMQNQLEKIFKDVKSKESQNIILEEKIIGEKTKANDLIHSLSLDDQNKYREYQIICDNLKSENAAIYGNIEEEIKRKEKLNTAVSNSQSRLEAVKLQSKLREIILKRNQLRDEEINKLSPAQEREKLISEVRVNNQSISGLNKQIKTLNEQLNERKIELAQIDKDLEEGSSERFIKYKELKKRDEMMENFQHSFQDQMKKEKQNVDLLKNQITFAIEQITLQGMSSKIDGNTRISASLLDENSHSSHEGLVKEYEKLQIKLKQLKILEKRIQSQSDELAKEENSLLSDIQRYNNLETLRDEYARKYEEVGNYLQELKDKKRVTQNVVKDAEKRNQLIKETLRGNEKFRQISHFEERLSDLIKDNKSLEKSVFEMNMEYDISDLKKQVVMLINEFNTMLCQDLHCIKN